MMRVNSPLGFHSLATPSRSAGTSRGFGGGAQPRSCSMLRSASTNSRFDVLSDWLKSLSQSRFAPLYVPTLCQCLEDHVCLFWSHVGLPHQETPCNAWPFPHHVKNK